MAQSKHATPAKNVLVVDDDEDMCWILKVALVRLGCNVTTISTAQGAISLVSEREFPIAFIDARLPDMDGLRLIEALREFQPEIRIIIVSGYYFEDDIRISEAVQSAEISGFLAKPFRLDAIAAALTSMSNRD